MHKVLMATVPLGLLLAGCAGGYPHYPGGDGHAYRVTRTGGETDYELMDRVLFANDSADLGPRAYEAVADIAADARSHPRAGIEVDGFTDTTGAPDHNMELSRARAMAVADVLARHGVDSRRIQARGFGETRLAVNTADQVSEPRNRRVVIRIFVPS